MSGSVRGGAKVEPNLTPILDMVFQLITFFMLVMNFKAAELDAALQLPIIGSAKPLPGGAEIKLLVLNVEIAAKCPQCDSMATLVHVLDDNGRPTGKYVLRCEKHGHETPCSEADIDRNGKTALSIYGRILTKTAGDTDHPSIPEYLEQEARQSRMAAGITPEQIESGEKQLDDTVVIRADSSCPFGTVNYILTECQKKGFRNFALKTGQPKQNNNNNNSN